eukprot:jgi/Ulvmu1/1209/UM109_0007.1
MEPLQPYISPSLHLPLATVFVLLGIAMSAYLCVYETAHSKFGKSLAVEGAVALMASVMLGCGTLFVLLQVGVYV